jgi:hypothetical protein
MSGEIGFAVRTERRKQRRGEIRSQIVPLAWYVAFFQQNLVLHPFLSNLKLGSAKSAHENTP